jgi:hypothetical protein
MERIKEQAVSLIATPLVVVSGWRVLEQRKTVNAIRGIGVPVNLYVIDVPVNEPDHVFRVIKNRAAVVNDLSARRRRLVMP